MSEVAFAPAMLPIALVYGDANACEHLRTALTAFNADIVYDTAADALDRTALGDSGARIAVVNLDDALDQNLDNVYAVLEACDCRVVFNDPASSLALEGWEHARWVRHLAAKLRDDVNVDPPRPASAGPVDIADAVHLGDQRLDDALGVLDADGGVPVDQVPESASKIDFGAVDIPADNIGDEITSARGLEPIDVQATVTDTADPASEAPPVLGFMLDDLVLELAPNITVAPSAAVSMDAATDLDADASATGAPDANSGGADELVWAEFEQQSNSGFANEPGGTAASAPVEDGPEPPTPQADVDETEPLGGRGVNEFAKADGDVPTDALCIDWSLLDNETDTPAQTPSAEANEVAQGLDTLLDATKRPIEDSDAAPPVSAPSPVNASADNPADDDVGASFLRPPSEWTLVDTTDEPAPRNAMPTHDESRKPATRVPGEATAYTLADREFGIELVDPLEYLAPAARTRETELYAAPELMSMAEALAPQPIDESIHAETVAQSLPRVVVMAASIGGPDAVREFLARLPAGFPALFVLAQHMGTEFIDLMVKQLDKSSALPVRVPVSGERAVVGEVLVVPNGVALTLSRKGAIELATSPGSEGQDPAIRATLETVAAVFGGDTLAVIFSGMIRDAVLGAKAVVAHGGLVWTQDSASCVVSTMVDSAAEAGIVAFSATPGQLARHLTEQFGKESTS